MNTRLWPINHKSAIHNQELNNVPVFNSFLHNYYINVSAELWLAPLQYKIDSAAGFLTIFKGCENRKVSFPNQFF